MALELEYRNTFIDVKEESEMQHLSAAKPRARSSPPCHQRCISFGLEAADEEDALRSYVGNLSQSAADMTKKLQTDPETPSTACSAISPVSAGSAISPASAGSAISPASAGPVWDEAEGVHSVLALAEFFPMLPSQGSLGHPEVCRRPCIYFIAGHCENGNGCAYCHMEHIEKTPKLDKRQRTIIQSLSRPQLLDLVRQFCHTKAEQAGFLNEAAEILDLLAQESFGARPLAQILPDRDLPNLHKTLARMNFSNLIGLVTHQSANRAGNATPSADLLAAALEKLRLNFLP